SIAEVERSTGVSLATSTLVASSVGLLPASGNTGSDKAALARVVAVALASSALVVLDSATLKPALEVGTNGVVPLVSAPAGPLLVQGSGKDLQVWVPVGPLPADKEHGAVDGGMSVFDENQVLIDTVPL